jgi:RNA polymerase sigma factor (sigma-70 family)
MAEGQLSSVMQHIRRLARVPISEELTDCKLLEGLACGHQEPAFAELMRRHGPMVFGVCRRLLGYSHDAEDAFQATFLVLFRRARFLGRRGSVASWLYTVAYHVALRAKASHASRRSRERQVVNMRQSATLPQGIWTDLQPVLDEELSRLPEKYRSLIILCYLEGKTNEQAARLVGCPAGTVKGRLSRAREILRGRLTRRGITLSAGAIGTVLAEQATAAVPTPLATLTLNTILAAAGKASAAGVSGPVAALAEGVLKAMFLGKVKLATVLILAVGLVGLGASLCTKSVQAQGGVQSASRDESPSIAAATKPTPAAGANEEPKQEVVVVGHVLDNTGKPLAAAEVALLSWDLPVRNAKQGPWSRRVLGQDKTDGDGRFRLIAPPLSRDYQRKLMVLARGEAYALDWQHIEPHASEVPIEVRLMPEQVTRGRLVDLQGQPAAGVGIHVISISDPAKAKERFSLPAMRRSPPDLACWPELATTDGEGRFSLHGLSSAYSVTIGAQHERFAPQELSIESDDLKKGEEVTRALAPARRIEGTVTYADTGKPVPDARLFIETHPTEVELNPYHTSESQADGQGRFLISPTLGGFIRVAAFPPAGVPYLPVSKSLDWSKSTVVKRELHLALPRGVLVQGTVTEALSGKPVAGAHAEFMTFLDNNPYYREDVFRHQGEHLTGVSGADGRFEVITLPGPGHLLINGPTLDYIHTEITTKQLEGTRVGPNRRNYPDALVKLSLKPQSEPYEVKATLRRGVTLTGRLVGPNGEAVQHAVMLCRSYIPYGYDLNSGKGAKEISDGRFELPGCDPEKRLEVFFLAPKSQLGARLELAAGTIGVGPVMVRLQPCGKATARFVRADGMPAPNIWPVTQLVITPGDTINFDRTKPVADLIFLANVDREHHNYPDLQTDAQGRATFMNLIPAATHWIEGSGPRARFHKEFTVGAGESLDLGEIKVGND